MTGEDLAAWSETRELSTPVSQSDIRRFAVALEDPNPLWTGEQALAPPTYILSATRPERGDEAPAEDGTLPTTVAGARLAGGRRLLNAGCELTIESDLRVGDVVKAVSEVTSHQHKDGASGPLDVVSVRTTYTCQRGLLALAVQTLVLR
jgi:hydroxyacyl-ACP dehydratase HTD2-like protein with hotdog domain